MVVASFGDGHIALSYRRIIAVDACCQTVTFTYRDYRHGSQLKELTLPALEFIRRFSLHILPSGLVRIRHYGILGNNRRKPAIENSARDLQMPRACRGASAAERCRQTDALSVVRKSRNSSCGLYRCRRRSAHDRLRANAMRFIMTTLRTRPASRLIHAFRQNPLWIRSDGAAVFVSPAKSGLGNSAAIHSYHVDPCGIK